MEIWRVDFVELRQSDVTQVVHDVAKWGCIVPLVVSAVLKHMCLW